MALHPAVTISGPCNGVAVLVQGTAEGAAESASDLVYAFLRVGIPEDHLPQGGRVGPGARDAPLRFCHRRETQQTTPDGRKRKRIQPINHNSAAPLSPQNSNSNSLPHLTSNGSLPPMPPGPVAHLPVPRPRRAIDVRLAPPPAPLSAARGLVLPPPAPPAAVPGSGLRSSAMPDGRLPGFEPMRVCASALC